MEGRTEWTITIYPFSILHMLGGIIIMYLRRNDKPEIKGDVNSPFWENREKFAASRKKCFLTEDTPQKHGYIISSYEPLADLFFLYFNIDQTITKQK